MLAQVLIESESESESESKTDTEMIVGTVTTVVTVSATVITVGIVLVLVTVEDFSHLFLEIARGHVQQRSLANKDLTTQDETVCSSSVVAVAA